MNAMPALAAIDISCIRNQYLLFENLQINLDQGEILHVTGVNGSGKSSLLQLLSDLLPLQQGAIYWKGEQVKKNRSLYCDQIIYLGHKIGVKANLTVLENLQLFSKLTQTQLPLDWNKILHWFDLLKLKDQLCHKLSAGQQQKVALTRLLISSALLWILDEPFTALDKVGIESLHQLLNHHLNQGGMVVITSHQPITQFEQRIKRIDLSCYE